MTSVKKSPALPPPLCVLLCHSILKQLHMLDLSFKLWLSNFCEDCNKLKELSPRTLHFIRTKSFRIKCKNSPIFYLHNCRSQMLTTNNYLVNYFIWCSAYLGFKSYRLPLRRFHRHSFMSCWWFAINKCSHKMHKFFFIVSKCFCGCFMPSAWLVAIEVDINRRVCCC